MSVTLVLKSAKTELQHEFAKDTSLSALRAKACELLECDVAQISSYVQLVSCFGGDVFDISKLADTQTLTEAGIQDQGLFYLENPRAVQVRSKTAVVDDAVFDDVEDLDNDDDPKFAGLSVNNACNKLKLTDKSNSYFNVIVEYIGLYFEDIVEANNHLTGLPLELFKEVLAVDALACSESVVLDVAVNWVTQNRMDQKTNCRKALEETGLLSMIRFPIMTVKELHTASEYDDLLTTEEAVALFMYAGSFDIEELIKLSKTPKWLVNQPKSSKKSKKLSKKSKKSKKPVVASSWNKKGLKKADKVLLTPVKKDSGDSEEEEKKYTVSNLPELSPLLLQFCNKVRTGVKVNKFNAEEVACTKLKCYKCGKFGVDTTTFRVKLVKQEANKSRKDEFVTKLEDGNSYWGVCVKCDPTNNYMSTF